MLCTGGGIMKTLNRKLMAAVVVTGLLVLLAALAGLADFEWSI